jgi:predicted ATPase
MKVTRVLLRWYKSFHLNYRGVTDKGETQGFRPWNKISPKFAPEAEFPFIEIPIESDITTIVGANESGKSHLLNAISKVILAKGLDGKHDFQRTDLCHYAGIRTRNVEAWPHIGLQFQLTDPTELQKLNAAAGVSSSANQKGLPSFALVLAPEEEDKLAHLFIEPNDQPIELDEAKLKKIREILPSVQFIDSKAQLASEIPLSRLIAAYPGQNKGRVGLLDRKSVEEAASLVQSLQPPPAQQAVPAGYADQINLIQRQIQELFGDPPGKDTLEMHLFREILDIKPETLSYLYNLTVADRGYIEGQIAKWNEELADRLNLAHFWRQDEQFTLMVNYKDGVIYFEIRDKTESIYTFNERSSGLKFFLSYYIQAKAMEMSSRNRNSIILMDEPDAALSILGQRNLLAVFESLVSAESSGQTCQLIYTTHSPYLINRNFPRRIRVVKKEDAEEGTQYIEQARARRYEPVRTALGIDSAPSLFLGSDNILVEGPTDLYLLAELIRVFATPENVGSFLDLNSVVIVAADGVGNVENVLDQSRWADEPIPPTVVLLDSDAPADKVVEDITGKNGKKKPLVDRSAIGQIGGLVKPFAANTAIVTIEDIVPLSIYRDAVLAYMKRWLPETWTSHAAAIESKLAEVSFGKSGLVDSTKAVFKEFKPVFEGDYDKSGVLQEVVVSIADKYRASKDDADVVQVKTNVVGVCDFIREALERSRAATAKVSTTQRVKRIVNDFNRLYKDNVPITAVQKLVRRLETEVAPIGPDGEVFLRTLMGYATELDELRTAGQERIAKDEWASWKDRIEQIKKNPLTVGADN